MAEDIRDSKIRLSIVAGPTDGFRSIQTLLNTIRKNAIQTQKALRLTITGGGKGAGGGVAGPSITSTASIEREIKKTGQALKKASSSETAIIKENIARRYKLGKQQSDADAATSAKGLSIRRKYQAEMTRIATSEAANEEKILNKEIARRDALKQKAGKYRQQYEQGVSKIKAADAIKANAVVGKQLTAQDETRITNLRKNIQKRYRLQDQANVANNRQAQALMLANERAARIEATRGARAMPRGASDLSRRATKESLRTGRRPSGAGRLRGRMGGMRSRGFAAGSGFTSAPEFVAMGAAAVIAKQAIAFATDFENKMAGVRSATMATEEQFQKLKNTAVFMSQSTSKSSTEIAEAMRELARAGFDVNQVLEATPAMTKLAIAGEIEMGEAAHITTNILKAFRMETSETTRVGDVLSHMAVKTKANVSSMGKAMETMAPVMHSLGASFEDAAAAAGLLSDAGIENSVAGTTMRRILSDLIDPNTAKKLKELGIRMEDINPKKLGLIPALENLQASFAKLPAGSEAASKAFEIFGLRGAPGSLVIMQDGVQLLRKYREEAGGAAGAMERMSRIMEGTLGKQLQRMGNILTSLILPTFEKTSKALTPVMQQLSDLVSRMGPPAISQLEAMAGKFIQFAAVVGTGGVLTVGLKGLLRMLGALGPGGVLGFIVLNQVFDSAAESIGKAKTGTDKLTAALAPILQISRGIEIAWVGLSSGITSVKAGFQTISIAAMETLSFLIDASNKIGLGGPFGTLEAKLFKAQMDVQIEDMKAGLRKSGDLLAKAGQKIIDAPKYLSNKQITQDIVRSIKSVETALHGVNVEAEKLPTRGRTLFDIFGFDLLGGPRPAGKPTGPGGPEGPTLPPDAIPVQDEIKLIRKMQMETGALRKSGQARAVQERRDALKLEIQEREESLKTLLGRDKETTEAFSQWKIAKTADTEREIRDILESQIPFHEGMGSKLRGIWESTFSSIESGFADAFEKMTKSTKDFKEALRELPKMMQTALVRNAAQQMAANVIAPMQGTQAPGFGLAGFGGSASAGTGGATLASMLPGVFGSAGPSKRSKDAVDVNVTASGGKDIKPNRPLDVNVDQAGGKDIETTTPGGRTGNGRSGGAISKIGDISLGQMLGVGVGGMMAFQGIQDIFSGKRGGVAQTVTGGATIGGSIFGPAGALVGAGVGGVTAGIAKGIRKTGSIMPIAGPALRRFGIGGGASQARKRRRRAKHAAALMAQMEVERQKERERAATQLQETFGGGLATTEGAAVLGQMLSGGINEAELQALEAGAGDVVGALGGAVGAVQAPQTTVTMNPTFIIRTGLDMQKAAQALGQMIAQSSPYGSIGSP